MNQQLQKYYDILKYILVVVFILAFGLAAFNQFIQFRYYNELIAGPCQLCSQLNPELNNCFYQRQVPAVQDLDLPNITIIYTTYEGGS